MIYGLDLFSGIGGLSIALAPWVRPAAYCENDRYAQAVLLSSQANGQLPVAPIWDNICTLRGDQFVEIPVNIIYGGFPCQDISIAGTGKGLEGKRSGLFFEIVRLTKEIQPAFIFLENVPAIRTRGLDRVCFELAHLGYDLRWTVVSAAEVGAPHLRKRWFLLAHANSKHSRNQREAVEPRNSKVRHRGKTKPLHHGKPKPMANTHGKRLEEWQQGAPEKLKAAFRTGWWKSEPNVGRVAHGIPYRVDRLKCLGNAVVPAQARLAFQRLMGIE